MPNICSATDAPPAVAMVCICVCNGKYVKIDIRNRKKDPATALAFSCIAYGKKDITIMYLNVIFRDRTNCVECVKNSLTEWENRLQGVDALSPIVN